MEYPVRVISVGDELAIVFPPEILEHLKDSIGDSLYITESPRGFFLSRLAPETPLDEVQNE